MNDAEVQLSADAVAALESGRVIEAIKRVRRATGLGLKESKDAVDRYLAAHPEVAERCRTATAESSRAGTWAWLALLALAVLAILMVFRPRG